MTEQDQLTQEIYQQLLLLYIYDLEVELLAEKLKNVNTGIPQIPVHYPWERWVQDQNDHRTWPPQQPGYWYGPPYKVTCQAE